MPGYRDHIYTVVLVGGKGKRLRPLSSDARPKAFISVTEDRKTMFRKTLDRMKKFVPENKILVVANKAHERLVKKDFPQIKRGNLLLEPVSRNTAPAITLAASVLSKRDEDAVMVIVATDQYIADEGKYIDSIKNGIDFVKSNEKTLVMMGIEPRTPSVELGYVKVQKPEFKGQKIYKVEKFTEKPDLETAKKYVKSGRYLWNAGAFIFKADTFLSVVKKLAPKIYNGLKNYTKLPDISIDYAIMEKARNIYCIKGQFRWCDMGSFENLADVLRRESRKFITDNGKIIKII